MIERLSGGFFLSAIESSMDSVRVLDLDGRLLFMNRGGLIAFEIDDFTPYAGRLCASLWPEPAAAQIELGVRAARRGETYRFEGMCPTTSGIEKWWDVYIAPVTDTSGALSAIIATSRDITAAHQLRVQAERRSLALERAGASLRLAFRIARVAAWEVDFLTYELTFSPEMCELLGEQSLPPMPIGQAVQFFMDDDRVRLGGALGRTWATGLRFSFDGRTVGQDGSTRLWRLVGEPVIVDGQCVAMRGAAQDVTSLHDLQERERSALESADKMSAFLATMGHELRTPLNGILGMTQALARRPLSQEVRDNVAIIHASGETLLALLNDLLDFSKIEAGKIELEAGVIDVQALVDGTKAIFSPLADDKGLEIRASVEPEAAGHWCGDPTRVRQVLFNLVSNAVKFTEAGAVEITVSRRQDRTVFSVSDSGIGIPANKLASIFDKFVQADATTTRRYGGSGLGLTICRELVALMGGEIWVESTAGAGATFRFSLPLTRAEQPVGRIAEAASGPDVSAPGLRVLAAEDNPNNQRVLKTLLGAVGIEPILVSDGKQALEAWRQSTWDIVLMDVQMPVMDGVTAVKAMREVERNTGRPRTPIIAITANAMASQRADYQAAGMDALVAKPINLDLLLTTMGRLLAYGDEEAAA